MASIRTDDDPLLPSKRMKYEIDLIPILPDYLTQDVPLCDVYIGTIKDPKTTSKLIISLNNRLAINELIHLKRVNGRKILLYPKTDRLETKNDLFALLKEANCDSYFDGDDDVAIVKVAKLPPKTRKQFESINKLWPCNFHSNKYLEKLSTNTLFNQMELEEHGKLMEITREIGELANNVNSTIVVDWKLRQIVAFGYECLESNPVGHSVMVAIDNVAKTQQGGQWKYHGDYEKIEGIIKGKYAKYFDKKAIKANDDDGPYLCTGYTIYTVNEPCITCAMALVHSRAKRVFFSLQSPKTGALGSLCKIHCVANLNHHYEAFQLKI